MKPGIELRQLAIGARFHAFYDRRKVKVYFEVVEKCKFNIGHGTSTRICKNLITKELESKSCNLRVIVVLNNTLATT